MDKIFDVVVIGGGVIGGLILRELSKYKINSCLVEAEDDICMGSSKANTGIVHGGFDAEPGTKKAYYNVLGTEMMPKLALNLGVKYKNNGSLVIAFNDEELLNLKKLYERGIKNQVKELYLLNKAELLELEPNISMKACGALLSKTAGIICPYELTIAAIGNAMDNKADMFCNFKVVDIKYNELFTLKSEDNREIKARYVINAAGIYADKIANMIGDYSFKMGARKGEYILLDRPHGKMFNHTLFFCPNKMGKGIVITSSVDENLILGPTAVEIDDKEDKTVGIDGFNKIKEKANQMCDNLPYSDTITSFAGIRAYSDRHDFIIEESNENNHFINVAGIESPGLSSAPAIALDVVKMINRKENFPINKDFNPYRRPDCFFKNLSIEEKNKLIKIHPEYGKIICRCEEISLGEILDAIRNNPRATNLDAIKRRTRSGMGRCQGGFCSPSIVKILADEYNIDIKDVTKSGKNSRIIVGDIK